MPGHMKEIGKNKFKFIIEVGRSGGKRRRITRTFHGGKREAQSEFYKLLAEYEKGTFLDTSKLTFADYLRNWLETYGQTNLAPKTYERYKQIIDLRVIPNLGNIQLDKLRPLHIKNFYAQILKEGRLDGKPGQLSEASLIYHHRVIHKALKSAVQDQLISSNPASAVEVPKPTTAQEINDDADTKENVKALDIDQVNAMLDAAKGHQFYPLLFVAVRTGLRRGELLALKWQDIDFKHGKLSVKRAISYTKSKGIFFKLPKTKKSRRTINISKEVIEVLKQHKKEQQEMKMKYRKSYEDNDLVFCQPDGRPLHPDTPSSWFPEFLESIGLPKLNFHCLRHTFASLMLKAGVDIKIVSEMLGHSTVRITYDIYSHLLPGMQQEAVNKFENLLKM